MEPAKSIKEAVKLRVDALTTYTNLMGASAVVMYLAAQQDKSEKINQAMVDMITAICPTATQPPFTSQVELKENAHGLYEKVQDYRRDTPADVVEMFEEGLSFLETLCEKYK
ncbi:hypothetical protein HOK51_09625 [Candidatus Woesearchaeota archaeon]|nr:hypothetical protein [Candidatus Woesearchaeota archaeon]MBT6520082.1 hypothetical protein [Candidatus Woesearchaeota archaeon]MBT7366687.1 hypothetical protein [Candidatus Woesearchaeota archaeon]